MLLNAWFGTGTQSDTRLEKPVSMESTANKLSLTPSHFQLEQTGQDLEETKSPEIVGPQIQVLWTAWWKGLLSAVFTLAEDRGFGA